MSRPLGDWADLKYRERGAIAHVFPFGNHLPLCGMEALDFEWLGTGTFDEIERAEELPRCGRCQAMVEGGPS